MTEANKDFIQLYSGIDFFFLEPDPDIILVSDIVDKYPEAAHTYTQKEDGK